jgi:hypothetical protein
MTTYTLAAKPAVETAVAEGRAVLILDRLAALAQQADYTIGPGGIQIHSDGSVTIDADRDPKADWAAFDPDAPTADEAQESSRLEQLRALETKLAGAGSATTAERRFLDLQVARSLIRQAGG